jgi:hypothetical protein
VPEQAELLRRRVIYVRDDEQELWADAVATAKALNMPLSVLVASALREYKPLVARKAASAA